jgi:hypothetical protein
MRPLQRNGSLGIWVDRFGCLTFNDGQVCWTPQDVNAEIEASRRPTPEIAPCHKALRPQFVRLLLGLTFEALLVADNNVSHLQMTRST